MCPLTRHCRRASIVIGMSPSVAIDGTTGALVIAGESVFPIGVSNPPPIGSVTPAGRNGLEEVAANGVNFIRTGIQDWSPALADAQIAAQKQLHTAAADHGLHCWLWLGTVPD